MPPPFYHVGPTAVGKTSLAVEIAERCGAEIVSADAFQVYDGMDLLTAKPTAAERRRAPHHLIGTRPLEAEYNVARFLEDAQHCLAGIAARARPALVVGGGGLYVKALTHGLSPLPPAQPALRAELEKMDDRVLLRRLWVLDPVTAARIDAKNKRRLIRAVEVCMTTGQRFSDFREKWDAPTMPAGSAGVFLRRERPALQARIERRVQDMFARGVVDEALAVLPQGLSATASRMIGWRELRAYLDGQLTLKECAEQIEAATRRYAKRQMTWFRGEDAFAPLELSAEAEAASEIDGICRRWCLGTPRL